MSILAPLGRLRRLVVQERVLVYRLQLEKAPLPADQALNPVVVDRSAIDRFFDRGTPLARRQSYFEAQGHLGVLVHDEARWLAFGWMATPDGPPPPHLPAWSRGHYWIFGLHTHPEWRGRGLMTACVRSLVAAAWRHKGASPVAVLADVHIPNGPSRRAFLRAGFTSAGEAALLRVPRLGLAVGTWRTDQPHTELPARCGPPPLQDTVTGLPVITDRRR